MTFVVKRHFTAFSTFGRVAGRSTSVALYEDGHGPYPFFLFRWGFYSEGTSGEY